MDEVNAFDLSRASIKQRGTGHAQETRRRANRPTSPKTDYSDSTPLQDGLTITEETKCREDRIAKLGEAKQATAARAKERMIEAQGSIRKSSPPARPRNKPITNNNSSPRWQ